MEKRERIAVIGGGNIGTQFACTCAAKGYTVVIHTSTPDLFDGQLTVVGDSDVLTYSAPIFMVSNDMKEVLAGCEVVFITQPASRFEAVAREIEPYITEGMKIGVIPGTGGAEFAFRRCIDKGAVLFGLQRVPAVARLLERGRRVRVSGIRDKLHLASIPFGAAEELADFISGIFDIPCEVLPNYLAVTLTPSNPILHTTRLYSMFRDYRPGVFYDRNFLFYQEWTDESSEILFKCDSELQEICGKLCGLDLTSVRSLKLHYESDTPEKLTRKIQSIKSFQGLTSPMKETPKGWVPNFESRYFSADFPYGLAIIEELAEIIGYDAKSVKSVMDWYRCASESKAKFNIRAYGINTVEDIYALYRR